MGKNAWSRSDARFLNKLCPQAKIDESIWFCACLQIFSSLGQSEFSFLDQSYFK